MMDAEHGKDGKEICTSFQNVQFDYRKHFDSYISRAYSVANSARAVGVDPADHVEVIRAPDLAARVEGIIGVKGLAAWIRARSELDRISLAFALAEQIIKERGRAGVDAAVRAGVAVLTEGVLVAPTDGIAGVEIRRAPDGSEYIAVSYAGPIRSAGGTAAALSVVLADFVRVLLGIGRFVPTQSSVERLVEEVALYDARAARLQYRPPDEDIRTIAVNCPVFIDGEPSEEFEVNVHRDVPGIATNRVRGGVPLVVCEGIAQKASTVLAVARKYTSLNWDWLEEIVKVKKVEGRAVPMPSDRYLDEIVAGRPIFAFPSAPYGFRLRYGRTRAMGPMAKALSPATMALLGFVAVGTQLRIERPGKSCIITPCDDIEGPVVKLEDGSVVQLNSAEDVERLKDKVEQILWLGDILITTGDFLRRGEPLSPAGICAESWAAHLAAACAQRQKKVDVNAKDVDFATAVRLSKEYGIPLHPKFTYFWSALTPSELKELICWLRGAQFKYEWNTLKEIRVKFTPTKVLLEKALIPHTVEKDEIVITGDVALAVAASLNIEDRTSAHIEKLLKQLSDSESAGEGGLQALNSISCVPIAEKFATFIGARMGRPEKARERKMKPPVHVLFPVGAAGGRTRSIVKAVRDERAKGTKIVVEIVRARCNCGNITHLMRCEKCGGRTQIERICPKCGKLAAGQHAQCGVKPIAFEERAISIAQLYDDALSRCKFAPVDVKGVQGMLSDEKIPELLEKGILRAKYDLSVFKDGTCRFDSTNAPLTHFYPKEIGTSVEKLRELGYTHDYEGKPLERDDQLCELKPQDIIISERALEYLARVANFVDDELRLIYHQPPFYNLKDKRDLIGHFVIYLSPHTLCGIAARIIGTTKAHVGWAHPYLAAASRRDFDGDENAYILLLDALLNFSRSFIPSKRGGQMDTPTILMTHVDPKEVDSEVYAMEVCTSYPADFYTATYECAPPTCVKIERIADRLGTELEQHGLGFTHECSSINGAGAPTVTQYLMLKTMKEKIEAQLGIARKINAVDVKGAAERVVLSHFLPDLYGNLRSFVRQQFRCVDCNEKYRRVPLIGKCRKCGGKLILTINRGGVEKYLKLSQEIAEEYDLPRYLKQRLQLLERDIKSLFEDETARQFNLAEFM